MIDHFIIKCWICDRVIYQCKCPAQDKPVQHRTCDECKPKEEKNNGSHL